MMMRALDLLACVAGGNIVVARARPTRGNGGGTATSRGKAAPSDSPRDFSARIQGPPLKLCLARVQSRQLRRLMIYAARDLNANLRCLRSGRFEAFTP